ncbi:hypothetical protein ACIA49_32935 [Kribbella sp. NPDC051587]|uniref:hypothetical protein n=1 Tax=Kribbella sp. NPDC051587 TaxID=3364119 RepID=UPI0037B49753
MSAEVRLYSILWQQQLRGFAPFAASTPMVCFSESPPDHLDWLLQRGWQPWGLVFTRQSVYQVDGGPVWYARSQQHEQLSEPHRSWAVRFDANPYSRSDWLHEREWRAPHPLLHLPAGSVYAVITGKPGWQPWGSVQREVLIDPETGMLVDPSHPRAYPQPTMFTELPPLWAGIRTWHWDAATGRIVRPIL